METDGYWNVYELIRLSGLVEILQLLIGIKIRPTLLQNRRQKKNHNSKKASEKTYYRFVRPRPK